MTETEGSIRQILRDIQQQEYEAVELFDEEYNKIVTQLNDKLKELADKRRDVLTDPNALQASIKANLTDVERCFNEMSLREISVVNQPVDERYQVHGTAAWPRFWLYALLGCKTTRQRISSFDRHILGYLRDVRCHPIEDAKAMDAFEVELFFAENPFFSNGSLKRKFMLDKDDAEPCATPIEWKDTAEALALELPSLDSDFEYDDYMQNTTSYISILDFFQPMKDEIDDINMAIAIKERICRDPLKYVLRYEGARTKGRGDGSGAVEIDTEDEEDKEKEEGSGDTNNSSGGRYPFSWLF
ncbi:nucleosome assembly protein [Babesia ovis]|uniref:Nucleosome assembly protein n=1 Tax=Babesia ovis TaxID=5869 RepID=A0A9W5TC88_BABOV|nr:nucleosome assembly protein [Babesia ovis]